MVELPEIARICRDPDDDKVIATAVHGMVDYLLTADNDLRTPAVTNILNAAGISVLVLNEFLKVLD